MAFAISRDGTNIGYGSVGNGPALVLVDGAMCWRASGPAGPLADQLKDRFTVYTYDRRGRGESGDTPPYAPDREIEDLDAVIAATGGPAMVYGISSGAALALAAAAHGSAITRMVLYEAPFIVDRTRPILGDEYAREMDRLLASRRPGRCHSPLHAQGRRGAGLCRRDDGADGGDAQAGAGRPHPRLRHGAHPALPARRAAAAGNLGPRHHAGALHRRRQVARLDAERPARHRRQRCPTPRTKRSRGRTTWSRPRPSRR